MPIVRPYNDTKGGEQGSGISERSTRKMLYCFDPKEPLTIYEWGGHSIPDAPEYAMQEPQPQMVREQLNGYNQTTLRHVDDEYIQGTDTNVLVPERRHNMAKLIVQVTRRTQRNFTFFTVSSDNCPDTCDYTAEHRGSGRLGEIQETKSLLAYDTEGDGGAVTKQVMLRLEGASVEYDGVRIVNDAVTGLDGVYSVLVGKRDDCSDDSFCPYQVAYVFDSDGVAVPDGTRYADKFGVSSAAIDGTALGAGNLITSSAWFGGDLYVGYAGAFKATSIAGGVAKSIDGTGAFVDVAAVTSVGIQALVVAGSLLHAFGQAGEWHYTSDGENWTTVAGAPLSTTNIFCAAYNPFQKRIYVGGAGGVGYAIDGFTVIPLTGTGAGDLLSAANCGVDHMAFGTTDGVIYENFTEANGGAWTATKTFAGGGDINALLADKRSSNLVAAVDNDVYQRSIMQKQEWLLIKESPDASVILSGDVGYEEHRAGSQYMIFGTTNGGVFEAEICSPCKAS